MTAGRDIALSSNDAHTVLDAANAQVAADPPRPDTLVMIDLAGEPRVLATLEVPGSVVGPPTAVWLSPDASWAIVTAATRAEAGAPSGIAAHDRVSVVCLAPFAVTQSLAAGAGATTVRVSPDGTRALVANRTAGSVSVFSVADRRLIPTETIDFAGAGPSGIGFFAGGTRALVSCNYDHRLAVLRLEVGRVAIDPRPITTALAPYTLDVNAAGTMAAVANMGRGDGDEDSVSLIDLTVDPPRCVATVGVGWSPEGLRISPNGRFLAAGLVNGTTRPPGSPFLRPRGKLVMFDIDGARLRRVCAAPIGRWSQGIAFSRDGGTVLVQNMVERTIDVFGWDGRSLTPRPPLRFPDGPAAIATAG